MNDLDAAQRFPGYFIGIFRGIQVDSRLTLAGLSPWGTGTRSRKELFGGLGARITCQNWDGRDRDITFKTRGG
jgi:hypothetical protein